jgi:hypothetical protein
MRAYYAVLPLYRVLIAMLAQGEIGPQNAMRAAEKSEFSHDKCLLRLGFE